MEPLRIGLTGFGLGQGKTGIATYAFHLWQALGQIDSRIRYDLLIPEHARGFLPVLPPNFQTHSSFSLFEQPLLSIVWHNSALPWYALARRYQLIHIPTIRRIPLIKTCPVIATVHDMAGMALDNKYGGARSFYHKQLLSRLIHRCDRILTVSRATKRAIVQATHYPENQIDVVYSGIDRKTFHPGDPLEAMASLQATYQVREPFIMYVSRIEHPGKNHIRLIEAFELFKKRQNMGHSLVFVGADWHGAQQVKERVAQSVYRRDIHWLGFVPTADLVRLYTACALMVFPSLYEGFGFPLLEAMACGALTACSNTTSLGELAQDYAETFDPLDPEAICQAMTCALSAPNQAQRKQRARAYAESFSWARTAQQVLAIYQQVAG